MIVFQNQLIDSSMVKKVKTIHLLWAFQLLGIAYYLWASYQYHNQWCINNKFYFTDREHYVYAFLNLSITLFFPLVNHFYLYDTLIAKKLFWIILPAIPIQLYLSMYANALCDTYYLKNYNIPWLMMNEHITSRIFINFAFIGLFGIQKLLEVYFKKNEDEKRLKIGQLESEIKLLRAQINPHFLFNSLNNIYSYSLQKKEETPELILRLSGILRYLSDSKANARNVKAEDELAVVTSLFDLYLVNKRWQERTKLQVEGNREGFLIEPHSILTLVENAFKYCNLDESHAFLSVKVHFLPNKVNCVVKNTIRADKPMHTSGTGLSNLERRLRISYGNTAFFKYQKDNNIFIAELTLPNIENTMLHS
jgi:sensor histidine kinase YesM